MVGARPSCPDESTWSGHRPGSAKVPANGLPTIPPDAFLRADRNTRIRTHAHRALCAPGLRARNRLGRGRIAMLPYKFCAERIVAGDERSRNVFEGSRDTKMWQEAHRSEAPITVQEIQEGSCGAADSQDSSRSGAVGMVRWLALATLRPFLPGPAPVSRKTEPEYPLITKSWLRCTPQTRIGSRRRARWARSVASCQWAAPVLRVRGRLGKAVFQSWNVELNEWFTGIQMAQDADGYG
jgi:hypothetical protein